MRRAPLVVLVVLLLVTPAAAWGVYRDIVTAPSDRAIAAYGAVSLPDGGAAWVEMTVPDSGLDGFIWTAAPQYWRVVRADMTGAIIWVSDEYCWQRAGMSFGGGSYSLSGEEWYDPKIMVLNNGNLLVYDSASNGLIMQIGPVSTSPPRSWIREIDIQTGATVWTSEITGWAITGVVERPDGGFWASAANSEGWSKPGTYWRCIVPEATHILNINATGEVLTAWRVHTEPRRVHSMSHPFGLAPVVGSDGEFWILGWKSVSNQVYDNNPFYHACLLPQIDRINPTVGSDIRYPLEQPQTFDASIGSIPVQFAGGHANVVTGYWWGRPNEIMRLAQTSDGGALVSYSLVYEPTAKLVRVSPAGGKLWEKTFVSPITGEDIPVVDMAETSGGAILVLLQDGDLIRINRLDGDGDVQQTALVGDPGGISTARRIVAAPGVGHPYGYIVTGSTSGFGSSGTDALVVRLDDLVDLIDLGSGALSIDTDVAYVAEDVVVTAILDRPLWDDIAYWISVVGEEGTLYETIDIDENQTSHVLETMCPPGNYSLTLNAYSDDYGILQALATAHLMRLDVGAVAWDRTTTYLGESPSIGYSYIPDYERYSYWIEIRDPADIQIELHRLPIPGGMSVSVNVENMTSFGNYTAEIFPIRRSDDHRIPGNTSTLLLSEDTWLYGQINDIHLTPIPGATITVQQPSHPDPEVAARVLSGISGATGDYEVPGLVPRYPAEVYVSAAGFYDHVETLNINISGAIHYPARLTAIPPPPLPEIGGTAVHPPRNNPAVGFEVVLTNGTATIVEVTDNRGHFRFPPLVPGILYQVYARNSTGHRVSGDHTYALGRGQTVDLLLEVVDDSLLPRGVDFTASPTSGAAPLAVSFEATGEGATAWHWDFGDWATGRGQTPAHTYGSGLWTVTLRAENYYGVREVTKEQLISVAAPAGEVPIQAPTRFVIRTYSGQRLENISVTATPLESTGPLAWLYDLFGISGAIDINGTVLSGSTDSGGAIVLPMIRTVKYLVSLTDPARGIDTEITIYPQEDEVVLTVWPQDPPGQANDFTLYAEEVSGGTRVGIRYSAEDLLKITLVVTSESGDIIARKVSTDQSGELSYVLNGKPGEAYIYGYVAECPAGEVRQDKYIRFASESRPLVDFADWIPLYAYHWAAIAILIGFAWTFMQGEIRGAMLTIPVIAGILWLIGWLQIPWMFVAIALTIGVLLYMRMTEGDLGI